MDNINSRNQVFTNTYIVLHHYHYLKNNGISNDVDEILEAKFDEWEEGNEYKCNDLIFQVIEKSEKDILVTIRITTSLLTANLITTAGMKRLRLIQGYIEPKDLQRDNHDAYNDIDVDSIQGTESKVRTIKASVFGMEKIQQNSDFLKTIISNIDETWKQGGNESALNIKYAKETLNSDTNFCLYQSIVDIDDENESYLGVITGQIVETGSHVSIKVHAVLAAHRGDGQPLMKELMHPKLDYFLKRYNGRKVKFVLESVPDRIEFYRKLRFKETNKIGDLTEMERIVEYH